MAYVNETSGVSVRDLRDALVACHEDQGATVRVVLYVRFQDGQYSQLRYVAQACDAQGRLVQGLPEHRNVWPNNNFRTLTQALWATVCQLYGSLEYCRYAGAPPKE